MRTIVNFFRCSKCREHDVDLSRMCRRDGCPKEHDGYTELRYIRAESVLDIARAADGALAADETEPT